MKDNDIKAELKALKAEIAKLNKKQDKSASEGIQNSVLADMLESIKGDGLKSQVQGLVSSFDKELDGAKASRLLMVFALGIVVGRLMSK